MMRLLTTAAGACVLPFLAMSAQNADKVVAYLSGKPIVQSISPLFPEHRPFQSAFAQLEGELLAKYADEYAIGVSEEEVEAQWAKTAGGITNEQVVKMIAEMTLILDAVAEHLRDPKAGEAFYLEKVSPFLNRKAWTLWKASIPDVATLEKRRAFTPRDFPQMKEFSRAGIVNDLRQAKALEAIIGPVNLESEIVQRAIRDRACAADSADGRSEEEQAIDIVNNARYTLWIRDRMRRPEARIVDEDFRAALEAKVRAAEMVLQAE